MPKAEARALGVNQDGRGRAMRSRELSKKEPLARVFLPQQPVSLTLGQGRRGKCSPPCVCPTCRNCPQARLQPFRHLLPSKDTVSTLTVASFPFSFLDEVTFSFNKTFPKRLVFSKMLTFKVGRCRRRILKKASERKTLGYA